MFGGGGGRPPHNVWQDGFQREKHPSGKPFAVCLWCQRKLQNTSSQRLAAHRKTCPQKQIADSSSYLPSKEMTIEALKEPEHPPEWDSEVEELYTNNNAMIIKEEPVDNFSRPQVWTETRKRKSEESEQPCSPPAKMWAKEETEFDIFARCIAMQLNSMPLDKALQLQLLLQQTVTHFRLAQCTGATTGETSHIITDDK